MCPATKGKRRPLTFNDRYAIEVGLNRGDRISAIARTIGRTPATVTREIKTNWTSNPGNRLVISGRNVCAKINGCHRSNLCGTGCIRGCWRCKDWKCNSLCPDYQARECERHSTAPYVCNACPERATRGCMYPYRFYDAAYAQDLAMRRRSQCREGIDTTEEQLELAVGIIARGLKKGQSPAHIIASNKESIPFSASTFYRYLDGRDINEICKLDLPRAVKYKPRKKAPAAAAIPRRCLAGRTYDEFTRLAPDVQFRAVEMDTVVGRQGIDSKCILTLYLRMCKFQFFILLPDKSSDSVVRALDQLQALFGPAYRSIFGVILADRGSEFADVERIECGRNGVPRTRLYFCDPLQSGQKGGCEKNHVELRRILPKGRTNFDALTNSDMATCMSHVNSYKRSSLEWLSPIQFAMHAFPRDAMESMGIEEVEPNEVNLTPNLVPNAVIG